MATIDRAQVRHVARLARLELSEGEEELLLVELAEVLGYVERLGQVDVTGVEPLSFVGDAAFAQPLREDVPAQSLPREVVLAQAPGQDGQAFLVPRILE